MARTRDLWKNPARRGRGKRWLAVWADPDGREHTRAFAKKADTDRYGAAQETDVARGVYVDAAAGQVTLESSTRTWLTSRRWDAGTRQVVEARVSGHIIPGLGGYTLAQLSRRPSVISGWLAGLPVGPVYTRHILDTLSSILTAAVDDEMIGRNPCRVDSVKAPPSGGPGVPDGRENGMHALRHHYASILLAGGVDIGAVSEDLGHHDPGFTLRVYRHLMVADTERARKAVEAALRAGHAEAEQERNSASAGQL